MPVATVPGRTFPVKTFFLEDAVEQSQYVLEENSEYAKKSSYSWQHTKLNISQLGGKTKQEDITWGHEEYSGAWSDGEEVDENTSEIVANTIYSMDHHRINYDLVVELLQYICENACELTDPAEPHDAAILVFLPGMPEIQRLNKDLTHSRFFGMSSNFLILSLHSVLQGEDTQKAFEQGRHLHWKPKIKKLKLSIKKVETVNEKSPKTHFLMKIVFLMSILILAHF